jgi:hypothetical protein
MLALAGCASMSVNSFAERGLDLKQYHSYAWAPSDLLSTGDPRLDNNSLFAERVQAATEKQLTGRGFEKTTGAPDLVIHYHANIRQRIDVNGIDREHGYCEQDDCRPYVYEAGTLLIDLVDPRAQKIVWRGWAEDSLEGVIDNQDLMEQRIDKAVARILARLPGRL